MIADHVISTCIKMLNHQNEKKSYIDAQQKHTVKYYHISTQYHILLLYTYYVVLYYIVWCSVVLCGRTYGGHLEMNKIYYRTTKVSGT